MTTQTSWAAAGLESFAARTYPQTAEGVAEALVDVGSTPTAVAETFAARGHRGRPGCERTCPVVAYLAALFPGAAFTVDPDVVTGHGWGAAVFAVRLPAPVVGFIHGLDHEGRYPDLDETYEPEGRA